MSRIRQIVNSSIFLLTTMGVTLHAPHAIAEETETDTPINEGRFFALPIELNSDFGAANGDATILRFMPLWGRPSQHNWRILHLNLITLADAPGGRPGQPGNPEPVPGNRVFGIGDLMHASFFTPPTTGNLVTGFGAMLSVPIASDSKLGSGKWSAGPAFRFSYKSGPWTIGAFGGQIWSFAGDDHRNSVSQMLIRGAIRRQLKNDWYFVSAPLITVNWKSQDEKWLVPLGGGIGKVFNWKKNPWALSLQGYYNVIRPQGAPDWAIRLAVVAAIPLEN